MLRFLPRALVLSLLVVSLTGCVAAAVGTAAVVGGRVAHDRRSTSTVINDRNLQLSVKRAIGEDQLLASHNHIRVIVYNRVIVLVGEVANDAARLRAGELADGFIGARKVVNQLDVLPAQTFMGRRSDNALGARIKTGLMEITSLPDFDPTRVNITVAHGSVYLMGLVTPAEGEAVVAKARTTRGVGKVVNLFEYTNAAHDPQSVQPANNEPAPETAPTEGGAATFPIRD